MSWLLAASFPGVLMLSAVGLQRLENGLHDPRTGAARIVERLEQSARTEHQRAAERTHQGLSGRVPHLQPAFRVLADEPGLPTRPNPRVRPSELVNPV